MKTIKKIDTRKTRIKIGFPKNIKVWKTTKPYITKHILRIKGHPVMEDWEKPYMKELAKISAKNKGVVLEVGFGMGIAARYLDQQNINKHIIIEANHSIANQARKFTQRSKRETIVSEGFWEEVINSIPNNSLDGILFDTYPMSSREIHCNTYYFFKTAFRKLKPSGIFSYYSDEVNHFSHTHLQKLIKAGFKKRNIHSKVVRVNPPQSCLYWQYHTILAPIIYK